MQASSKFDMSSGSPDRPLYTTGQRGSYTTASLDRPGSFRENMENPILSALPNMSRNSSAATQGDVMNFVQCLRFDPKSMVADLKLNRYGDFRRLASVALGVPPDDSPSASMKAKLLPPPSPEELKRFKTSLNKASIKARERGKIINEASSVLNKCFPSVPSRKRSRLDVLPGDRSNAIYPTDRTVSGTGIGKMGAHSHGIATHFDLEQQKTEERAKNKRTRTSVMGARAKTPTRPSGNVDRDKEMVRIANSNVVQCEDRTFAVDGWEKSKMKKKRSGIKPDGAPSSLATKPIDGYREPKGVQPRLLTDARSRLNDTHGFRPGVANGAVGVAKADGTLQQNGLGMRSSIPRTDHDNNAFLSERRDRSTSSDKERVNIRAINKTNAREDLSTGSPNSTTKLNPSARAPRSGSGVVPKSPMVQRAAVANDWELSQCTSKLPAAVGANNRKRTLSMRSSSPPAVHCAGQRLQKISRTARRTNLLPIASSNDETPPSDTISDVGRNENASGIAKRLSGNSPQQVKLKVDHFSSTALSESEESVAAEMKDKDGSKKSDEMDEKAGHNIQKMSTLVLPPKKNKVGSRDGLGDGVRRQGRTGRGIASTRSLVPMTVEKHGNVGTAKQLGSARHGFHKTESKTGRPPSRKLSDRKAYVRQKHTAINAAADFLDDGHEELLAAANAVINPAGAFSSSFWGQMERFFDFISDVDIAYLKQQGNLGYSGATPTSVAFDGDRSRTAANGFRLIETQGDVTETESVELRPGYLPSGMSSPNEIPIYQRLIAALIPEEGIEELCCNGNEDLKFDTYGSRFELEMDMESDTVNHGALRSFELVGHAAANGYRIGVDGRELENDMPDDEIMTISDTGILSNFDLSQKGLLPDQAMMPGIACSDYQYNNMSLNERLLIEIQSIGLYPEPVPELAPTRNKEISGDINRLEEKYDEQVSKRKSLLGKLLKYASETRELQQKEFELHAIDKLVGMAYEKYMSCRRSNAPGGKSASSKMAKQAALAFVKRTLERCHEFDETGKSCFSEPLFRDMFLSGSYGLNDALPVDAITDGESGKLYVSTSDCSMEVRTSASLAAQQSPSLNNHEVHSSEQTIFKEDTWSNRKKELLLDDVGGTIGTYSGVPSGIGSSLSSNAKGKRSDRDREGKGSSREGLSRNGTTKIGRPASGNVKGERKPKTKPKQKTTQLSASVNGLLGKISEYPKATLPSMMKSSEISASGSANDKDEFNLDVLEEPLDFSKLQIPEMDVLGGPDDLGGQEQDFGSWLDFADDGLQDDDFMGLEIPMDDLSDLNMMV